MPSTIEWTDETWNPVTGCTPVSPGCDHCYMFALYPRLKAMGVPGYEGDPRDVRLLSERLEAPFSWGSPRRVFVNSMSDLFHPRVPFEFVNDIFDVMHEAAEQRGHIFQVLTKRPGRAVGWWESNQARYNGEWPKGVWIGTSVENQKYAPRIAVLARLPAAVRFVSAEPLLGAVDFRQWLDAGIVHWVIAGGESGPAARPMELEWARDLRDQSIEAGVAFFLKQLGGKRGKRSGEEAVLDGEMWTQYPEPKEGVRMPPKTTTWDLEPHTVGKHMVLQNYMGAWLPILTSWNGRVLFIDAFAGSGEYSGGEPGSPVIALRALINHRAKNQITSEVKYLFIEKDPERCEHLEAVLKDLESELPPNCYYQPINSSFDDTLTDVLDNIDQQNAHLAPAFVMIDPFGVSETPMRVIERILENSRSEVYISFMYRDINRFRGHPNFEKHLDDLFGCPEWREGIDMADGNERKEFFYSLYGSQLKKSGAQYVVRFELYEGGQLVYAIFFGTKSLEGCDKMKQAIWKVAPFGDFKFRGGQLGQLTLGEDLIDFSLLEKSLQERFATKGWQRIEDIEDFVKSDATDYHSGHLKRKTLTPMEKSGKIEVERPPGRRGFVPGTRILFW